MTARHPFLSCSLTLSNNSRTICSGVGTVAPAACSSHCATTTACMLHEMGAEHACAAVQVVRDLGTADVDARLEELLIDGILYAFQEQVSDDANVMLNGFGTVVNSLKMRATPYLPQICGTIKWRLNNKSAKIRQQAADLIARIAIVMKVCSTLGCRQAHCYSVAVLCRHCIHVCMIQALKCMA